MSGPTFGDYNYIPTPPANDAVPPDTTDQETTTGATIIKVKVSADTIVVINEDGTKTTVQVEHIDSNSPQIPPPQVNNQKTVTMIDLTAHDANGNPFFAPSFAAAFAEVMLFIENQQKNTTFMEAQEGIRNYGKMMQMAQNNADLTILSAENQAQQTMLQAISLFVSATLSGLMSLKTMSSMGKSEQQAKEDYSKFKKQEKAELAQLQEEQKVLEGRGRTAVSDNPDDVLAAPPPAASEQNAARIKELKKQISEKEDSLAKLKANKNQWIKDQTRMHHDQDIQLINERLKILTSVTEALFKVLESSLERERGKIEALKQLNDGYMNILRTFMDNTSRYRDAANDNFNKLVDLLTQVIQMTFKAHSLQPG